MAETPNTRPLGERLAQASQTGTGHEVNKIDATTPVGAEVLRLFPALSIDTSSTILTPSQLLPPLPGQSEGLYRGYGHDRAVNWYPVQGADSEPYTLTIKGGNLLDRRSVVAHRFRLRRDIPGSVELGDSQLDWNNSQTLQQLALAKLGRFTYTTIPFSVRVIDGVPVAGKTVGVKDYFDSPNYPIGSNADYYGVPEGVSVGEYIMGKDYLNLEPSEYLYLVHGLNTRVDELTSYTIDNDTQAEFSSDAQFQKSGGIQNYGQFAEFYGFTPASLLRASYTTLGERFGVDISSLFPDASLPSTSQRQQIVEKLTTSGISNRILDAFIDKICEVATLGHSEGYSFTLDLGFAGSLASRNVTFEGAVLDLTSLTKLNPSDENALAFLTQDMSQLIESVGCLRRMISKDAPADLLERITKTYLVKLTQLGTPEPQIALLRQALTSANSSTL